MPSKNAAATTADFHLYTRPVNFSRPLSAATLPKRRTKNIYYIGVARSMFVHSSDINKSMNEKSPTNSCGRIKSFLWKLSKDIWSLIY